MPRPRKKRRREVNRVPRSDALMPEYDRGAVPDGLVTRRQFRDMGLCLSKQLGCCLECHDGTPVDPSSCMTGPAPAAHRLAA
ncbi:hypothetical protein ACWGVR_38690 [Streptomyces xanthophaeus]